MVSVSFAFIVKAKKKGDLELWRSLWTDSIISENTNTGRLLEERNEDKCNIEILFSLT